ncbi:abc transporter family protein [Stylonychia lemnae]|uniref:Abc transporter family protein n=1 Tax=Stylonychia lemnae TaxID=5949 RepID=A0A078AHH9_STYLE|nr:abc transporter family protein [Stylonychia lemnae]|eukprot:CDW81306.1 abc transporter family protein [Stylonychia lemnae]
MEIEGIVDEITPGYNLNVKNIDNTLMKKILTNISGYAKPKEMIAIMGASGSGKTSLLNVLAQRLALSPGSVLSGEVKCNNRDLDVTDFGKIGAFVQQDDILIETMTPRESFVFAAKLRTSLDDYSILVKVGQIISRLGLEQCADTRIGGVMLKGISGGERKRTSIGYELITDPSIVLLDEPTSGLDSSTAVKIAKILKNEAKLGKTVIATIHQPSSELFMLFDRLILLHDGYQVYQGPVSEIKPYLDSMEITVPQFKNVAEFTIKMVQVPRLIKFDLTFEKLRDKYVSSIEPAIFRQIDSYTKRYEGFQARFSIIQEQRTVTPWVQFREIFKRNLVYMLRNPRTLNAAFFNAIFIGLLTLALYYKVGDLDTYDLPKDAQKAANNWVGLSFLLSNNMMFPSLMLVIIQMPLQVPVFKRELMNKMYTPTIYFFGRITSGMIIQIYYPIMLNLILYFGLGINISAKNFFLWLSLAIQINLIGCAMGYFCGVLFDNDTQARSLSTFLMLFFMLVAGGLNNSTTYIPFIQQLQYISPMRYGVEGFFRGIIRFNDRVDQEKVLDKLGFNIGDTNIHVILLGIFIFSVLLGWFVIWFRNRKY